MKDYLKKIGLGLLGLVIGGSIAWALTSPPSYSLRQVPWQTTTHYRMTINYNDGNITAGVKVGSLPVSAFITAQYCHVLTVFNAGVTNQLLVGTTQGAADWLAGGSSANTNCNLASATFQPLSSSAGMGMAVTKTSPTTGTTGGWDLWVKYSTSGTAASTGQVIYIIEYVPNDDL